MRSLRTGRLRMTISVFTVLFPPVGYRRTSSVGCARRPSEPAPPKAVKYVPDANHHAIRDCTKIVQEATLL